MKKIALFLALVLSVSFMVPFIATAEEGYDVTYEMLAEQPQRTLGKDCYEVVGNGSFEFMDSATALNTWGFTSSKGAKNTFVGGEYANRSTDAHSKEYSMQISVSEEKKYCDMIAGAPVITGQIYEFSVWMKRLEGTSWGHVNILFQGQKKGIPQEQYGRAKITFPEPPMGEWVKGAVRFTAPKDADQTSLCLCFYGPGTILWDDASLLCITNEMPKPEMPDEKPAIKTLSIPNAGFEEELEKPEWELFGLGKRTDEYAHSGKYSVALHNEGGSADGIASTIVGGFEKGATYQISAWILTPGETNVDMGFWLSYSSKDYYDYYDTSSQLGMEKPRWTMRTNQNWTKYIAEFTPPEATKSIMIDFRHRLTPGLVYIDDVSVYMVKEPYALTANTDEVFYYTEWETGVLSCTPYVMDDPINSKAEMCLVTPDGTETHKETVSGLTAHFDYTFRTEWLTEKGKQYQVRLKVSDGAGNVIQAQDFPVYRFDRPTYLGADGIFRKNGKEYTYTFGSGATMPLLEKKPEKGGITVVQLYADDSGLSLYDRVTKAYEQGFLCLITLYTGTKSAAHPDRLEYTIKTVETFKDHPGVFGYVVMDEPYQKGIPDEEMMLAYETIRNIDPNHPVYLDDSVPGSYGWLFRYADFVDVDYYGGAGKDSATVIYDLMESCRVASKGRKPFSLMEQAFPQNGYLPSCDEFRHMAYQALFAGAHGYGFHSLGIDSTDGNNTNFMDRPEWTDIAEKWGPWERDFMYKCFVTGEYKFVNFGKNADAMWATYTDGTDLYAIALNQEKAESNKAEIPLFDATGEYVISSYVAKTMTGESKRITGEGGTLSVDLAPWEAVVWKVTPTGNVPSAAHLKDTSFNDIIYYPWAYNAITTLEEKGIVNRVSETWYGPQHNITRGDYAMFLVRTLGLTGSGENFADVDPAAEYAKELAIGKANGVINGIGDNKFNPEAEITRQDMMTMTSRALKLAGAADLSAFSDASGIADYAQSHVAAMVAEGLIKGNADGTINPRGNTTRAEAAVIMQRIINK